jgi:hypothetical protein
VDRAEVERLIAERLEPVDTKVRALQRLVGIEAQLDALEALEGLRIVAGYVNASGVIVSGTGFTAGAPAGSVFTVTFDPVFSAAPVVVIGSGNVSAPVGAKIANGSTVTASSFQAVTFNTTTGAGSAAPWTFVAIGLA